MRKDRSSTYDIRLPLLSALVLFGVGCIPNPRYAKAHPEAGGLFARSSSQTREVWDTSSSAVIDTTRLSQSPAAKGGSGNERLVRIIRSYLGTPYHGGGMTRKGMDCSGLVWMVFNEYDGRKLPRSSSAMAREGVGVPLRFLRTGDLLFFTSRERGGRINHVGIFLNGRDFAHASSTLGVTIGSLDDEYHSHHLAFARRILK